MTLAVAMLVGALSTGIFDPVPAGSQPSAMDEEMTVNAIPTRVREWTLNLELAEAQEFYRHLLGERHVELSRNRGFILAAPTAGGFTTVELLSVGEGRTRARVSEARLSAGEGFPLPTMPSQREMPIPLPPDARILSIVGGARGAGQAQTLVARSALGLRSVAGFYERELSAKGLQLIERRGLGHLQHPSELLSFTGGGRRVEVVLTRGAAQTWISAVLSGSAP